NTSKFPCDAHGYGKALYSSYFLVLKWYTPSVVDNFHKHLVMKNEQATISPSWSIHSGVGTSDYTFIWAMCGENITYSDMDMVEMNQLK
ncbi:hypothetical protein ACT453_07620, partial [Bacillus sp. D-CC]